MSTDATTAKAIFLAASDLPTPADRAAYLDDACAGNAPLRSRVEALLRAHDRPDRVLDQPAALHAAFDDDDTLFDLLAPSAKPGVLGRLRLYDVLEVIGRGGMGVVLRATDTKLNRVVAVKVLSPVLATHGPSRQRFVREAQSAAAVAHDNIVAIYAVEDAGPVPYLVMQYVSGCTLQQKLDRVGPLPLKEVLRIGIGIANGLAAAHRNGLVHRDVKPANILLENGIERVKITDFGLARAVDDASLTRSGVIAGTPHYMSPEQADGDRVDHRSDLFSLGSVMYALCTGHPPFRAATTMAVLKRVSDDTPRPIRELNPDVPDWLAAVVAKLLAKDPARRFAGAAEVADLLTGRLAQVQTGLDPRGSEMPGLDFPTTLDGPRRRSVARRVATALGAIGVVAAGVALAAWGAPKPAAVATVATVAAGPTVEIAPPPRLVVPRSPSLAEVLAARPSPLDGRRRNDIPRELLELVGGGDADRAPEELVGVLAGDLNPSGVAFSPDGRYLACGGNDWFVRIWDLRAWEPGAAAPPCRVLRGHASTVWTVAFSPNGRTLASGSFDGTIILWDAADGRNTGALAGHSRLHSLLTYSPEGRTIAAGGDDGSIHRWDVATGQRSDLLGFHDGGVRAVAYSPDERLLGSAGLDGTVQVFDAATGRRRHRFAGTNNRTAVAFSPDGRVIAAGCDAPGPSVRFWDVETGEQLPALTGHTGHVGDVAYHPLGRLLATGSWDCTARVWDLEDRSSRVFPVGPNSGSSVHRVSVAWSPEGRYLAAARERRYVCLFRIPAPAP